MRAIQAVAASGSSSFGSTSVAQTGLLLMLLQRLQAGTCTAEGADYSSSSAWQLLLAAKDSRAAASIVPAAAQLLVCSGPQLSLGVPLGAAALLAAASHIVGPSSSSSPSSSSLDSSLAQLEQVWFEPSAAHHRVPPGPAVQYAALKAAVAAAPHAAGQWWQWAAWLHDLARQQQQQQQPAGAAALLAAQALAFTASCRALAYAASCSGATASGGGLFGALPVMLQILQLLTQDSSGSSNSSCSPG